jgi:hypothetical protein
MNHINGLRALADESTSPKSKPHRAVIYVFLSGGLAQHESFDPKPEAPDTIRGEFAPIATRTPGIDVCEHLPMLAAQSDKWALVRSLTHPYGAKSKLPGRDHWGAVQSVFFAGGGVKGGTVIGSSDRNGAYPSADPQTPENMAATIYQSLGLPQTIAWKDHLQRPHQVYHGDPIGGLT